MMNFIRNAWREPRWPSMEGLYSLPQAFLSVVLESRPASHQPLENGYMHAIGTCYMHAHKLNANVHETRFRYVCIDPAAKAAISGDFHPRIPHASTW
jgi:hypothetical protein